MYWVTRICNQFLLLANFFLHHFGNLDDFLVFHICRFKLKYENPILRGNDKHASDRDKYIGSTIAKVFLFVGKDYYIYVICLKLC